MRSGASEERAARSKARAKMTEKRSKEQGARTKKWKGGGGG